MTYQLMEKSAIAPEGYMSDLFTTGAVLLGFTVFNATFKVAINFLF